MLVQYLLHNNKTVFYIEYILFKFDKRKITFENYCLIDAKLFKLTFNYPKFYVMTHFVKCIQNHGNIIIFNIAYSKTAYKYFLKAFINRTVSRSINCRISSIIYIIKILLLYKTLS